MTHELVEFASLLDEIRGRIRRAQTRAVSSANREMLVLYWDVGRLIESRQEAEVWGSSVIPRLARALRTELPEIKGFSKRNLGRMIRFYREYPTLMEKVPQPVALLEPGGRDAFSPQPVARIAPATEPRPEPSRGAAE
ncbi:MAG: hypothetical protein K0U98_06045 [Deltaproteobacteria bacterium]|nr:hypothetical protein [Deltaproteobacteria bacterium]